MISIGQHHEHDAFYRYKRDTIQLQYEQTNGITTKLMNLHVIVRQIHTKTEKLCKYIQKQLGVPQITGDKNGECFKIAGRIVPQQIEHILERYIEHYILCPSPNCKLPEWDDERGCCRACGYSPSITTIRRRPFAPQRIIIELLPEENKLDILVVPYMYQLYELREKYIRKRKTIESIDRCLDKCWSLTNETRWPLLLDRINEVLS